MGQIADGRGRNPSLALGVLERVRLDLVLVGLEVDGGAVDELALLEAAGDDLAPDRIGQRDVAADIQAEPDVRPFRARCAPWIDGEEAGALVDRFEDVVEEDRMRLAGVAAPQDDQIGVLDFTV